MFALMRISARSLFMRFKSHGLLVAICMFYIYLAFHMISGSQGLFKLSQHEIQIKELQSQTVKVQAQRVKLERHARQLRAESLSRDTLGEKARQDISVSHVNDLVIVLDPD